MTSTKVEWFVSQNGEIPENAIIGGVTETGETTYIGRIVYMSELLPARIVPSLGSAFAAYDGQEHANNFYEVACANNDIIVAWQPCQLGAVPQNGVKGGFDGSGQRLYVGRVFYKGAVIPGYVYPIYRICSVGYQGSEVKLNDYEVLISMPASNK